MVTSGSSVESSEIAADRPTSVARSMDLSPPPRGETTLGATLAAELAGHPQLRTHLAAYARRRFPLSSADLADVFQDACVSLLQSRNQIRNPAGYLLAVFHGACCRATSKAARERTARPFLRGSAASKDPENVISLSMAMAKLTPRQRALLLGYFFEGRSLREVSSYTGVAESSAWTLIGRALKRLRKDLSHGAA